MSSIYSHFIYNKLNYLYTCCYELFYVFLSGSWLFAELSFVAFSSLQLLFSTNDSGEGNTG